MPKAIGYRVVVEMDKAEEKIGSFYLPAATVALKDELMEVGTVKEIGPQAFKGLGKDGSNEPWVKVGDKVYLTSYGGNKFKFESGKIIRVINDENIIAIVSEEDSLDRLI